MRTGTVSYKLEDLKKGVIIPIGFVGENDFTRVIFDAEEIYKKYPSASVSMKVQPPKGVIYPAAVTRDGNTVIWQVKEADVANRGGGELQLTFIDGETKIKTYIAKTDVKRSLAGNGPAPDPVQDWVDNAEEVLDDLAAMDNIAKTAQAGDVGKALSPKTVEDGVVTEWQYVEPGAGTDDYADLDNKPSIAGVTLSGNKTLEDLGIAADDDLDNLADEVSDVKTAIQGKYTKPSSGIPASDIADGVIPVVDSALSYSSENAVQNKVVKGALDTKAPVIINTVTGNPAVFNDGYGLPIKSLLIPFTPQQEGTGDPSPQNIRSILPWNGLTVFGGGKNLIEFNVYDRNGITGTKVNGKAVLHGTAVNGLAYNPTFVSITLKAGTYTASVTGLQTGMECVITKDGAWYGQVTTSTTFTLNSESVISGYIRTSEGTEVDTTIEIMLEKDSTASAFEPFVPITDTDIVFPSAVYGGEYEAVSGRMMDGWAVKVFDGSPDESWYVREDQTYGDTFYTETNGKKGGRGKSVCDAFANITDCWGASGQGKYGVFSDHPSLPWTFFRPPNDSVTTLNEWKAWLANNPIHLAYQLATPQEQTLTGHQITALVGNNTIWSDADGQLTVAYPADTKTYISNLIATAIASL